MVKIIYKDEHEIKAITGSLLASDDKYIIVDRGDRIISIPHDRVVKIEYDRGEYDG